MLNRRSFLASCATGMAGTMTGLAQASSVLPPDAKMQPVDDRNGRNGWAVPQRQVVKIKQCVIGEGAPKVIASTTAKTPEAFLEQMKTYGSLPELDAIEIRADYLGELTGAEMAELTKKAYPLAGQKPVLFTFRNKHDGGTRHVEDQWYADFNKTVLADGMIDWLDIEEFRDIELCRELVKAAKAKGKVTMFSDHEFGWTPSEEEIIRRLVMQDREGSDILKLAVMAHNTGDALRLMSATWKVKNYFSVKPMLTMAMGRYGVLSRACGEFFGSDLTFAMVGGVPSAPGQIPYQDVKHVMDVFHTAMYPTGAAK